MPQAAKHPTMKSLENYENHKINFIGSVAYFLQEELEVIATKYNCKLGMVIKNPIDKLIEYHFKK